MADTEKLFTINLRDAYEKPRKKRAGRAVKLIKEFASRHMKTDFDDIRVTNRLNAFIWAGSISKPPRKVKVRILKHEDLVYVFHIDEEAKVPEKKVPKEEKEEKKEAEKPAEAKEKAEKAKPEGEKKEKPKEAPKQKLKA